MTWAAWLYFVDEMTQGEVAKTIGVSGVTVIKLLNDARRHGIVSMKISPKIAPRATTSRGPGAQVRAEFGNGHS